MTEAARRDTPKRDVVLISRKHVHAPLMAARAEVARLAGLREQVVVPAGVAVDARKPVMRVAAPDEALDHPPLDRAPHPPCLAQLPRMPLRALPQRARALLPVYRTRRRIVMRTDGGQQKTPALSRARGFGVWPGGNLLSRAQCTLSSAQTRFTVLFGMGRRGSRLLQANC